MSSIKFVLLCFFIILISPIIGIAQNNAQQQKFLSGLYIEGNTTDGNTGTPIRNVLVRADTARTYSDSVGFYSLHLVSGSYDVHFQRDGYQSHTEENVYPNPGATILNVDLWEDVLPPVEVIASVNENDTECLLEWPELPTPLNEIVYDNGDYEAEYEMNQHNEFAVKFSAFEWPTTLKKVKAKLMGDTLSYLIKVYNADGDDGYPGTLLGSKILNNNFNSTWPLWCNLKHFSIPIPDKDFYISISNMSSDQFNHEITSDKDNPAGRSYFYNTETGEWEFRPDDNYMIRAFVPVNNNSDNTNHALSRSPVDFKLIRLSNFNPDSNALNGDHELINQHYSTQEYIDTDFGNLDEGWYAYAVASWYQQGGPGYVLSDCCVSNVVGHLNYVNVDFNITKEKENKGFPADSVQILMFGLDFPYESFSTLTDSSGYASIVHVWKGNYEISIGLKDYYPYLDTFQIVHDTMLNIELEESKYMPGNFYVDSISSLATWDFPEICVLDEDFEDEEFPPPGWQTTTEGVRLWWRDSTSNPYGWQIEPWDSYYAVIVDNGKKGTFGSDHNGCCDYLISPRLDLQQAENFRLEFDQYFTGAYGSIATIEYSNDAGEKWHTLKEMSPSTSWNHAIVDLSDFSGSTGINPGNLWISWHHDDGGGWAYGWAIDNVKINVPKASDWPPTGIFDVLLDSNFTAQVDSLSYRYQNLEYGKEYIAGVTAFYETGMSDTAWYNFTSAWLYPPENFHRDTLSGLFICTPPQVPWPNGDSIPENLIGYNFYVNNELYNYQPYMGEDSTMFEFEAWDPTWYEFGVSAVYDLTPQGMPGDTGESMKAGPLIFTYSFGHPLPFYESWESASFDTNHWETEKPNWQISDTSGIDFPCAVFCGNDTLGNSYNIGLISYPLLGTEIKDGEIILEFDLKFERTEPNFFYTQHIEIKIWENNNWHSIENIRSTINEYYWQNYKFSLYPSNPNDFKIAFFCNGSSNNKTFFWYLDNIKVYRKCIKPYNLQANILYQEPEKAVVNLSWSVDPPYLSWKSYNDGSFENSICSDGGEGLAQYFNMYNYDEYTIQKIRYFNSGDGMFQQTEEVYILTDDGEEILRGPYFVENAPADNWVEIEIDPIDMDAEEDFMIATFNQQADGPKIGMDDSYYDGSLYLGSIGDFLELGEYSYYYVGSHEAGISMPGSADSEIEYIKPNKANPRELIGFNIWRNDELIKENHPDYNFTDSIYESGEFCYYVSAVYDQCESDTTEPACVSFFVGKDKIPIVNTVKIYPNPTRNELFIESKEIVKSIKILNSKGMLLYQNIDFSKKELRIDCGQFKEGIIILRIELASETLYRKVLILH